MSKNVEILHYFILCLLAGTSGSSGFFLFGILLSVLHGEEGNASGITIGGDSIVNGGTTVLF